MKYYSLKYNGNIWRNRKNDLVVGQCLDADLKLPSSPEWEDENYFVIRYIPDTCSWCIVRLSDNIDLRLDGCPLGLVDNLHDGAIIEVENNIIKFNISDDTEYNGSNGIVIIPNRIRNYFILLGVAIILLAGTTFTIFRNSGELEVPEKLMSSIKKIHADSLFIQKLQDGVYVNQKAFVLSSVGTCFILSDGTLVTARHCIHPWLMGNDTLDFNNNTIRKEIMAIETKRELWGDTTFRAVVKLKVCDTIYYSTDFSFNTERDIVYNAGTRDNIMLWRSIRPTFHHRDCELGDIAWLRNCGLNGNITLANEKQLTKLQNRTNIAIVGFPENDMGMSELVKHSGQIIGISRNTDGAINTCLHHKDDASSGDSGGPVFIRHNNRYYVISVMSRKDKNDRSSWSVPISEIYHYEH